ncbi:MAG: hypothetical protein ACK4NZ_14825 [Tsuneonella sp.]
MSTVLIVFAIILAFLALGVAISEFAARRMSVVRRRTEAGNADDQPLA